MKARWFLAALLPGVALLASCSTVRELHLSAPPPNAGQAQKWWQTTLSELDVDTLAVYAPVCEVLRSKKATATYCFTSVQRLKTSLDSWSQRETHLPAPMPESFTALVQSRLAGYKRQRKKAPSEDSDAMFTAEAGAGCTAEQALDLWRRQEAKLGW